MRHLVNVYTAAGAKQTPGTDNVTFTLAESTTYFAELFDDIADRIDCSVHWKWNATLAATITLEASNFPAECDPSLGSVTSYAAVGSGWATTGATAISPAASASEVVGHYADYMAMRMRAKIVVGVGGGGTLRGTEHSKMRGAR